MYGEVRKSLETAQLVFDVEHHVKEAPNSEGKCSNDFQSTGKICCQDLKCKFAITPSEVSIFNSVKDETTIFHLPPCLQLVPQSCSSANLVNQTELHLRIKVLDLKSVEIVNYEDEWTLTDGQQACIACQRCGNEITRKSLKKVIPMPSSDWEGVMEELWCCRSKDVAGVPPVLESIPEDDECLSGYFEIILSPTQLIWETVTIDDPQESAIPKKSSKVYKTVHCSRCRSCLGKALLADKKNEITAVHLWKCWTILHQNEITNIRPSSNLEYLVTSYIKDVCKQQVCFKFIVESEDHKAQILLWLVSPDSLLLWSDEPEMLKDERNRSARNMNIQCISIMKVLYQTCWDDKGQKMNDEWSHDMMVHSFILPLEACYQLAEILTQSTHCTPKSMRSTNSLMIGYLKTS
ncbi:E3 ubiquitin-protein ligase E3D [Holothuria leucospilota]|uniref:E3 ubiquitin-protein ligase E3D n=1 Tax=Holothuria leucospilota TaxID=206669 RepID=A0A9Q0YQ02_HOLLE|nr:E3 ubiquitin-protein ligase E3D [Holothuria leucospilota]